MVGRLSEADVERIADALAAKLAPRAPVSAPAAAVATDSVAVAHIGPSGKPDGRIHPCTATPPCGRLLRSKGRAAIHGVEAGGHTAA